MEGGLESDYKNVVLQEQIIGPCPLKSQRGMALLLTRTSKAATMIENPITAEIIPYGNPDGQGDLAEMNQVAYRTEAVFSYAVLDPKRIAVLKAAEE